MPLDISALDQVIHKTISVVDHSREEIFDIAEQARLECDNLLEEIELLKKEVKVTIDKGDELEKRLRKARLNLVEVSRNFQSFNEEDIKEAYEQAHAAQAELILTREREKYLRKRRDELQFRLRKLGGTVDKAEDLMTQMNVVMDYLSGDLQKVGQAIADAKQQQKLGLEVIRAQEEERRRLAREIHDGPAQQMANVVLRTELIEKISLSRGVEEAQQELQSLKKMVRESLGEVRRIIFNLRPMALDDLGLIPTLDKYIQVMNEQEKVDIHFKTWGAEKVRLPSSMEVALFRFVQECLTNVVKHAQASEAWVKIEFRKQFVILIVEDNGIGFDPEKMMEKGFGILGMKERMKLLNGSIDVQSSAREGTKLTFKIPLQEESALQKA